MSTDHVPQPNANTWYPGCVVAALLLVLVPVGAGLGFLGWLAMTDTKEADDHLWGGVAMAGAAGMIVGGLLAIMFVLNRKRAVWIGAATCLVAGLIADVAAVGLGLGVVAAAQAKGGDWGSLAVATAKVFCVAVPISSAILTAIALACVWRIPYQRRA